MQRKISKLGRKTGLKNKELKKMCRFSLSGLLAVAVASLTGCLQTNRTYQSEPAADQSQNLTPAGTVKPAGETQSATEPEAPKPEKKEHCGPYPGYPCGTKYYTVSISDILQVKI